MMVLWRAVSEDPAVSGLDDLLGERVYFRKPIQKMENGAAQVRCACKTAGESPQAAGQQVIQSQSKLAHLQQVILYTREFQCFHAEPRENSDDCWHGDDTDFTGDVHLVQSDLICEIWLGNE
jgi:hypothetical protein